MADSEEELAENLAAIEEGKLNFPEDEQNVIDAWIAKLSEPKETEEENLIRKEYARTLAKLITVEKQLLPPFNEEPLGELAPLLTEKPKKYSFTPVRLPCWSTKALKNAKGAIPKTKKRSVEVDDNDSLKNNFENAEEMARVIARSKGLSFAEFVAAISRHTADYGQQLKIAMKSETTSFREYVDHVLSQRIKDLTEVLDEEQNAELQRIKKDIDRWQAELSNCKKRIREMIPNFDMDEYKKDKNYLNKVFKINQRGLGLPEDDDSFKKWKEETCHRLKWYSEMIYNMTKCNERIMEEISDVTTKTMDLGARQAINKQNHTHFMTCEFVELKKLHSEKSHLTEQNKLLISQLDEESD